MDLNNVKRALEEVLSIVKWEPTDEQLIEIAARLKSILPNLTKEVVSNVVTSVIGNNCLVYCCEGLDNSDIITLLKLAQSLGSDDD